MSFADYYSFLRTVTKNIDIRYVLQTTIMSINKLVTCWYNVVSHARNTREGGGKPLQKRLYLSQEWTVAVLKNNDLDKGSSDAVGVNWICIEAYFSLCVL